MDFVHQINVPEKRPSKFTMWWYDFSRRLPGYYRWSRWYWTVKRWIFPARPRLLKAVGRQYRDLTYILPHFMFECVIEFVEGEEPFKRIVWPPEEEALLKDLYDFVKVRRPAMEKEVEKSLDDWAKSSKWMKNFPFDPAAETTTEEQRLFDLHNKLEAELMAEEDKYLRKILEFRRRLWT